MNDYNWEEISKDLTILVHDSKKALIHNRFSGTNIGVNDLFLPTHDNLFRNEFKTRIWMFGTHSVAN